MPGVDGLAATRRISADWPETRILVLTSFAGVDKIMPAIKAGALGYLLKDSDPEVLVDSIRQAEEEVAETAAGNPNGIRRAAAGFNGNCYLPAEGMRGRVALTQDWTSK